MCVILNTLKDDAPPLKNHMETQTIDELKAEYRAAELAQAQAEQARADKEARDAETNFNDAKAAALSQLPACLIPFAVIEQPDEWSSTTQRLQVLIKIPKHSTMDAWFLREHNSREWVMWTARGNWNNATYGVNIFEIEYSSKEKYAHDQWVGWMQDIKTTFRLYPELSEALVVAEREYARYAELKAQVDAANAELENRVAEYLAARQAASNNSQTAATTTEERFMSALKDLILEFASQMHE